MNKNELFVLTFVLQESDQSQFNNLILTTKKYLISLDINFKKNTILKINKAGDFYFYDPLGNFKLKNLKKRLINSKVDFCLQLSAQRKKKLLISDMDGTIIENETLNDIANFLGKGKEVKQITDLGLKGRLDFSTSLENRVHLLKGLRLSSLEEAKRIITFKKGAKKLFRVLKDNNFTTVLVSGGFKPITSYVQNYLKIDHEYSNSFGVIGDLFDGTTNGPIINANYKEKIVNNSEVNGFKIGRGFFRAYAKSSLDRYIESETWETYTNNLDFTISNFSNAFFDIEDADSPKEFYQKIIFHLSV